MSDVPDAKLHSASSPASVRRTRPWRSIIALVLAAVVVTGCYNTLMMGLAKRWDDRQPRNPRTGVLEGAEAFDLGPTNPATTAVLLVHGFIGGSNNFNELPAQLAQAGYHVRALRLPGHGTTPFDLAKTDPAEILQHVLDETRALQERYDHVFLVGHSMGGTLTLLTATMTNVDGIVLAGAHFKTTYRWWYVIPPEAWTAATGWAIRWVYKSDAFIQVNRSEIKDQIVSYRYVPVSGGKAAMRFARRARDPDVLAMVTCPVLMIHGRDDSAASPKAAEEAFQNIASGDKTFIRLENSDHHVFWDYDREQANAAILDFIAKRTKGEHTP